MAGKVYGEGDLVIPLAQPFRPFIKEVMETQVYPERHYTPGGQLISPYDITSWSLPLHRHVISHEIKLRSEELEASLSPVDASFDLKDDLRAQVLASAYVLPVGSNESFRAAFHALSGGLKVERLTGSLELGGESYPAGSFVVYPGKEPEVWNRIFEELPFEAGAVLDKRALPVTTLTMPRIALVETWFHDMDAGWTRFIFDGYHIPFSVLRPGDFAKTDLAGKFDVIIFPDSNKDVLMTGKRKSGDSYYMGSYHPDYVKGIEKEGMEKLMAFSEAGGTVISWGGSTSLFEGMLKIKHGEQEEEFNLPFRDISSDLSKEGLSIPGSLLRVKLIAGHPLTLGMPESIGVYTRGRPVFQTSVPQFDMDRRVIGSYPERGILVSGYAAEEEKMGNKAAMIWMKKGEGQFVFYGFSPQFRGSTQGTFKLLFNAILL